MELCDILLYNVSLGTLRKKRRKLLLSAHRSVFQRTGKLINFGKCYCFICGLFLANYLFLNANYCSPNINLSKVILYRNHRPFTRMPLFVVKLHTTTSDSQITVSGLTVLITNSDKQVFVKQYFSLI